MPKEWTDMAHRIREENPNMEKGEEWAISTNHYKKKHGHPPRRHHKKKSEVAVSLLRLADELDLKGLTVEADLIDKAWFDPKVMNRSVERVPLLHSVERNPTEKNYCFNCGAPIPTLESKCEACNYEPTKREETPGFKA